MRKEPRRILIPELLAKFGWTQRHLANITGVSESSISRMTTGQSKDIKLSDAIPLADAFGVDVRELIEWSDAE